MRTESTPVRRGLLRILAGAPLAAPVPAHARRSRVRFSGSGMAGRGAYAPDVLTQDQLARCLTLERDINAGADGIETAEEALKRQETEIDRLGRDIDLRAARVDRTSQAAVDGHNRLVSQHRAMVRDFNARLAGFNARVEAHNAQVANFNGSCAQRRYYESDMQAVRTRLGLF